MLKNEEIVKELLQGLYTAAGRRSTQTFAVAVIGAIIKTLEQRFNFLKYVTIQADSLGEDIIKVDSKLNSIDAKTVARAMESIVQVVYMDLKEKAGLYFIKELQRNAGDEVISSLKDAGIDLGLLELQQQYLFRRQNRKIIERNKLEDYLQKDRKPIDNVSLLGYSLENVSTWKFDAEKHECIIYGKDGIILDKLNLDNIVKNYIGDLTEDDAIDIKKQLAEEEQVIELTENEFNLLEILKKQDTDASTVCKLLHISEKNLSNIIRRLLQYELLQYISADEVAITEIGEEYLIKRKEKTLVKKA